VLVGSIMAQYSLYRHSSLEDAVVIRGEQKKSCNERFGEHLRLAAAETKPHVTDPGTICLCPPHDALTRRATSIVLADPAISFCLHAHLPLTLECVVITVGASSPLYYTEGTLRPLLTLSMLRGKSHWAYATLRRNCTCRNFAVTTPHR
jgi:hypothetical protein